MKKNGGIIFLFLQFPITESKEGREGKKHTARARYYISFLFCFYKIVD